MPQTNFHLETFAAVDADFAYRVLSDLNNHLRSNPFLVKIEVIREFADEQGQLTKDLRVTERPHFGPLRYTVSFHVREIFTGERELLFDINAAFGTILHTRWEFQPEDGGTRMHEYVTIETPALTLNYVRNQAFYSHSETFRNLPAMLAGMQANSP